MVQKMRRWLAPHSEAVADTFIKQSKFIVCTSVVFPAFFYQESLLIKCQRCHCVYVCIIYALLNVTNYESPLRARQSTQLTNPTALNRAGAHAWMCLPSSPRNQEWTVIYAGADSMHFFFSNYAKCPLAELQNLGDSFQMNTFIQ